MSEQECAAFRNVDELLSSRTSSQLEEEYYALSAVPKKDRLRELEKLGVHAETIDLIRNATEDEIKGYAFVFSALTKSRHPSLFEKIFGDEEQSMNSNLDTFGKKLMDKILKAVLKAYDAQCLHRSEGNTTYAPGRRGHFQPT